MTQTISLKVSIDCDACKRKVKKALEGLPGVDTIDVDMKNERVIVVGSVDPKVLVKKLAKVGKKVELPGGRSNKGGDHNHNNNNTYQDTTDHNNNMGLMSPFGSKGKGKNKNGLRGKVAASGDSDDDGSNEILYPESYAHLFSDENANSCTVM